MALVYEGLLARLEPFSTRFVAVFIENKPAP